MQKLYLLCNAHIDPVWLWRKREGVAETLSTFRVAADFCEEFEGFVFNHNEAVLYEWVMEHDPALFERIKKLVAAGKWRIMGGWYLQPDCNMPSGESFLRHIRHGHEFFNKHFGIIPQVAINFDPFGHTQGLVQILAKCGYKGYLHCRPVMEGVTDYVWRGFDGSEVTGHFAPNFYGSPKGKAIEKIKGYIEQNPNRTNGFLLWGIGDHGGGPSREDLIAIEEFAAKSDIEIIHSYCEEYFDTLDKSTLPVIDKSLVHVFPGCYTTMVRIKQNNRLLENKLALCEKMYAHTGETMDAEFANAEKALMFLQFHDVLPGTSVKTVEAECLNQFGYASEIAEARTTKAFLRLCQGQKVAKDGEIPIMVYNPHPYELECELSCEFQLADMNHTDGETTVVYVKDADGNSIPCQNEKEECTFSLDWRKKTVFYAKLAPMSMNRFDCELVPTMDYKRIADCEENNTHFVIKTDKLWVEINKSTGLLDKYSVGGKDIIKPGAAKICVYRDNEDPWVMDRSAFPDKIGEFKLVSDAEANAYNGYPDESHRNVRVIENGAVRTVIQATFKYNKSYAVITYSVSKQENYVDIHIKTFINDVNTMYKLCFDAAEDGDFRGQTAFGTQQLENDGTEVVFHKWCRLGDSLYVMNKGTYGGSSNDGELTLSLLRTAVYSAHPINVRPIAPKDRCHEHIDMGEREFDFRITSEGNNIDYAAEVYNQQPITLSFFPDGSGDKRDSLAYVDNKNILMTSLRKVDGGYQVRLYNSTDSETNANVTVNGVTKQIDFGAFEVKTYIVDKEFTQTNMI
ncbi:MAG: alpha-mannosidase [Clostridia bacterium]|nr:alpha-mannosidase [Clostridia bacterium]